MKHPRYTLAILAILISILTTSCTENSRAKHFGGTITVSLPKGTKFVNATWKDTELWYSYRPTRVGETPEVTIFKEQSSMGIWEGEVRFHEQ